MDDPSVFEKMDEQERMYAPESVPGAHLPAEEVDAGGTAGNDAADDLEPPAAAPVASPGTAQNTMAAPPNLGRKDEGGAPGDPDSQARYPIAGAGPDTTR